MCPSEVSDIEASIWQAYQDLGVRVWGIAPDDSIDQLERFRNHLGITFPILIDDERLAISQYEMLERDIPSALYPQDWIISPDGRIAYGNSIYEPDEMRAILDTLLEESR
ncbi:MAG: redoxin domain-containing protein [Myxococcota bacterium]|nr:redoxin domain-containing protein [Myxococcota bacterium]